MSGYLLVGQSGGPTAVINSSLLGVIEECRNQPNVTGIIGTLHGIEGIFQNHLVDLSREEPSELDKLRRTPAAILGSGRYKLQPGDADRLVGRLDDLGVRFFVYIGGNDSADTAHQLALASARRGSPLRVAVAPKTIDNDLPLTDHCPGYGSIARFAAIATQEAGRDSLAMRGVDAVKIIELMGRHAGWVVAASTLGKVHPDDPPHVIYPPERRLDPDQFLAEVEQAQRRLGYCVVVVAETIRDATGGFIGVGAHQPVDSFGHTRLLEPARVLTALVQQRLGLPCRYDRPGTMQRMFTPAISHVDAAEAYLTGQMAARAVIEGETDRMVVLRRLDELDYQCTTDLAPLEEIANREKLLPADFLDLAAAAATPAFRAYAQPLIGLPLPAYARLRFEPFPARAATELPTVSPFPKRQG